MAPTPVRAHRLATACLLAIVAQVHQANGALTPIKLLKVEPVKGYVGRSFTVTGTDSRQAKKWIILEHGGSLM